MKKLVIINADDYGRSKGLNYGIIEAHINGIVTSTTAMVNMPDIIHGKNLLKNYPNLAIGLHFTLSCGKPLTQLDSLIDENGNLCRKPWEQGASGSLKLEEIKLELVAQYNKFIEIFGKKPTHIDSHHHVHMIPEIFQLVEELALKEGLPIRVREIKKEKENNQDSDKKKIVTPCKTAEYFDDSFYGEEISEESFIKILNKIVENKYSSSEIMCHPGYLDKDVLKSKYCNPRLVEIDILTSENIKKIIEKNELTLGSYGDI